MESISIILTILGIIIGTIVTVIVSKYFFKKSVKKKQLVPYVQFLSSLFNDLKPDLQADLIIKFKNKKVQDLTQVQFVIANTGDIPIQDIIQPLKLSILRKNKILSADIIHIEPEGREIECEINEIENNIHFKIPLLNGNEFFVLKLLIQDNLVTNSEIESIDENEIFQFTITAADLPPKLVISDLPYSSSEEINNKKYNKAPIKAAVFTGIISIVFTSVLYAYKFQEPSLYIFSIKDFFNMHTFNFFNVCIILLGLLDFIFLLLTGLGIILAILELKPSKKSKIVLPKELRFDNY